MKTVEDRLHFSISSSVHGQQERDVFEDEPKAPCILTGPFEVRKWNIRSCKSGAIIV